MELTILMPCLNEEKTLKECIREAMDFIEDYGVQGEVLIADNNSRDHSRETALSLGARVEQVEAKGYGAALRAGIMASRGTYVIMGDCDGSYDFLAAGPILDQLRQGADLVVGNRFAGNMEKGAMPTLHRYLGVPFLSFLGRVVGRTRVRDFHCGLRGVRRESFLKLETVSRGMEFASEMIVLSSLAGQRVQETPVSLRRDRRGGKSHLRSVPDGLRHVALLLKLWVRRGKVCNNNR